ncbi:MAG: hypothetical protein KAG97_06930, partial [Victivallales bacterium]|nr:hypothetical protein [Victivallales bacterium]
LKSLDAALVVLSHISDSVLSTFKDDIGKNVKIKLRKGVLKAQVASVDNGTVVVRAVRKGATVSKRIEIQDLDYDEIALRLGRSNEIAGAFFMGIVAMKKREYDTAEKSFNATGLLAPDLARYLSAMREVAAKQPVVKKKKLKKTRKTPKKINYNAIAMNVKVSTLKKTIISGAGKKHTFKARLSVRNMTGADLKECQLEMLIIGENVLSKRVYKTILRKNFDLDLNNTKTMKKEFEFKTIYYMETDWGEWAEDSNQENVGYKFVNWICVVKDLQGNIKKVKTRNKKFSKVAEKIIKMSDDAPYDKNARVAHPD